MPIIIRSIAALSIFMLVGCAVSTPFSGPGYDAVKGVTAAVGETVHWKQALKMLDTHGRDYN